MRVPVPQRLSTRLAAVVALVAVIGLLVWWRGPELDLLREAFAAVHLVANPLANNDPWLDVDLASALAGKLPQYLENRDLLTQLPVPEWLEPYRAQLIATLRTQVSENAGAIVPFLRRLGGHIVSLIGNLGFVVLVPVLSFFFLKDGRGIRDLLLDQIDGSRRLLLEDIFADVHVLLALFMRALVVLSLATFIFYAIFFAPILLPREQLPEILQAVAGVMPVTYLADAMRAVLTDLEGTELRQDLVVMGAFAAASLASPAQPSTAVQAPDRRACSIARATSSRPMPSLFSALATADARTLPTTSAASRSVKRIACGSLNHLKEDE